MGASLDGFIARLDGSYDFLPAGGGEPHGYDEFMASVDCSLAAAPIGAVVEQMAGSPAEIVSQLTRRWFGHAYVDGGITITRVPVLIGTGIPLFGATPRDIQLKHIATQEYGSGLVKSEYQVVV